MRDFYYLRQGGCVFVVVCLSVCLLASLRKNVQTDLDEIFKEDWQWDSEQMVKFLWPSGSPRPIWNKNSFTLEEFTSA